MSMRVIWAVCGKIQCSIMIKKRLITALFIIQPVLASPLSEGALRLIKIGNEIGSPAVVTNGQSLLLKGMFKFNDLDSAYEASKQARLGSALMGHPPQIAIANKILSKLLKQGYDPAIYDSALYLLDGGGGFAKNELMALKLLEESVEVHANAQSAFIAAVIRNESLVPGTKDMRRIDELITYAVLNKVKGATKYQAQHIDSGRWRSLKVKNWRKWIASQ
ncbi:hypothetical protein [uncultured Gammaproteobacteria bacterium]|nr:hypothetical protein [uncultured Gammaproteobacteria bacterium]